MSPARIIGPLLTLAACFGLWLLWKNLALLRGTPLWEIRNVVLVAGGFLLLTVAEWLTARIRAIISPGSPAEHD